jgi:transposase-like protein
LRVRHVTIYRWVQRFTPLLADAPGLAGIVSVTAGRRTRPTSRSLDGWRWVYRAVDQFGQVMDVLVSPHRDVKAARRFFERATDTTKVTPVQVVTDRAATYPLVGRGVPTPSRRR